jgi:DNA primase
MSFREKIRTLKEALSVPEYFRYKNHKLHKVGRQYAVLCPFHQERTPSCFLYEDHYHCFGCEEHGDVIDAHQILNRIDFQTALEELGRMAGLNQYHPARAPGQTGGIKNTRKQTE